MLSDKIDLFKNYGLDSKNTGSYASQIVILGEKIRNVILHLSKNKKDVPAKRSMLRWLSRQRKLLSILKKKDSFLYSEFQPKFLEKRGW